MSERSIFITGAAAGIGAATARRFAARGWCVGLFDVDQAGVEREGWRWRQGCRAERAVTHGLPDVTARPDGQVVHPRCVSVVHVKGWLAYACDLAPYDSAAITWSRFEAL